VSESQEEHKYYVGNYTKRNISTGMTFRENTRQFLWGRGLLIP